MGAQFDELRGREFVETLALLDATARLEWFPLDQFYLLGDAIHSAIGDKRYRAVTATTVERTIRGEVFDGLVTTFRKLFGTTPAALLRAYPTGYAVLYRACGRVEVEVDAGEARVHLVDIPEPFIRPSMLAGFAGSLEGLVVAAQGSPAVALDRVAPSEGRVTYRVRW